MFLGTCWKFHLILQSLHSNSWHWRCFINLLIFYRLPWILSSNLAGYFVYLRSKLICFLCLQNFPAAKQAYFFIIALINFMQLCSVEKINHFLPPPHPDPQKKLIFFSFLHFCVIVVKNMEKSEPGGRKKHISQSGLILFLFIKMY